MADSIDPTRSTPGYRNTEIGQAEQVIHNDQNSECLAIINTLRNNRDSMYLDFSNEQRATILDIEGRVNAIRSLFAGYIEDPSPDNKAKIKQKHRELTDLLEKQVRLHKSDVPREEPPYDHPSMTHFDIYAEQILNPVYNRFSYKNEIDNNLAANRALLQEKFNIPLDVPIFQRFLPGETHNGGKKAILIGYPIDGNRQNMRTFVYNPRGARIDQAAIETFRRINALPPDQKSSQELLPDYQIVNLEGNSASVWEYIPGKNLSRGNMMTPEPAGSYLSNLNNEELKIKLVRLDEVLSAMHVSDVHGENIIMKPDAAGNIIDIVPVDLENVYISPNREIHTKLQAESIRDELKEKNAWKPLTQQEREEINTFVKESTTMLVRYIPLGTTNLGGLILSTETLDTFMRLLGAELAKDNIELTIDQNKLKNCILKDLLQAEIPFFTEKKGIIYYGTPKHGVPLGKRR